MADVSTQPTAQQRPHGRLAAVAREAEAEERRTMGVLAGGSSLETLGGLVAVVVSVLGFATRPLAMAAVATIAIGVALLAQGGAIAARWSETLRRLELQRFERSEIVGGVGTEVFGGGAGIVLGVLALAGVLPEVLLPAAAIVYGASLLLGGSAQPDLAHLAPDRDPRIARVTYAAVQASGGIMVLVGVAAAVLGILALLAVGPALPLTLVAMLVIGAALLFAGGALTARLLRRFARAV
jgi:hypothetical protein